MKCFRLHLRCQTFRKKGAKISVKTEHVLDVLNISPVQRVGLPYNNTSWLPYCNLEAATWMRETLRRNCVDFFRQRGPMQPRKEVAKTSMQQFQLLFLCATL